MLRNMIGRCNVPEKRPIQNIPSVALAIAISKVFPSSKFTLPL